MNGSPHLTIGYLLRESPKCIGRRVGHLWDGIFLDFLSYKRHIV